MLGEDDVIHTVHTDAPAGGEALYGADAPIASVLETAAGEFPLASGQRLVVE